MRFEWDEAKNWINQAKHQGLSFEIAARVFADPNYVLLTDRIDEGRVSSDSTPWGWSKPPV
jgi:uncharacterized protein